MVDIWFIWDFIYGLYKPITISISNYTIIPPWWFVQWDYSLLLVKTPIIQFPCHKSPEGSNGYIPMKISHYLAHYPIISLCFGKTIPNDFPIFMED